MSRTHVALLHLAVASFGCSIPLFENPPVPRNECVTSDDCAGNSVCVLVGERNACAAINVDLPGLLLEIRTPVNSSLGSVAFLIDVESQELVLRDIMRDGQVRPFNPQLPELAQFKGTLRLPDGVGRCGIEETPDGSFPASAVLRRVDRTSGLPPEEYAAGSHFEVDEAGGRSFVFRADLPRGLYDVYVTPQLPVGCEDGPLPVFWPAQEVDSRALNFDVRPPERLWGRFAVPTTMSVDGWSLELVEPEHGDIISETLTLAHSPSVDKVSFDIHFDWTARGRFDPLIRLRPPVSEALPTLHWDLSAVGILIGPDGLDLSLAELNAVPRHVEGQVLDAQGSPVVAAVQIQSAEIAGDASSAANYRLEVETDVSGIFTADLPPGHYRIVARPVDPVRIHAVASKEMEIPAGDGCFCGQSITVSEMVTMEGHVLGPGGESIGAASVVAAPSTMASQRYFDKVLALPTLRPREAPTQLVGSRFSLKVDPGSLDFSTQPVDGSGYPWLVRPRLLVAGAEIAETVSLGSLTVPYPVFLQGVIRDTRGGRLPHSVVRAWLPVGDPLAKDGPAGVIQIGETLALGDGTYTLPLPPSLSD
ncbi:carboxypeptidase-like regulatory domain-containing protein [Chondromyces crocatus]|uniref:Carboxypeptidase regulatory-like domain-containing protein n=1 Tax=Chondromyces crocatus TaxID=52 RepID=A0A0K1E740_CHOCO|nr:carboxypeptidase-like regulatory domain-containing protein [Chondromyces crocatus]AKT36680.1 uncharacterized protein CMC5_008000 [Chondromyces crocatus]